MAASKLLTDPIPSTNLPELSALGQSLRRAREARGLSLEDLAARLNMGLEQLQALEEGNRERLKESVFVIAQARRVAGSLGVSVDGPIEALRRNPAFTARPPSTPPTPPPGTPGQAPGRTTAPQPAARHRPLLPLKPLLLLLAAAATLTGAAIGLRHSPLQLALPKLPALNQGRPATSAPAAVPSEAPASLAPADAVPSGTLRLSARGRSWLEVESSAGQSLFRGTLEGEKSFPLGDGLRVLAGRPDLVSAQVGAGPARVLGGISEVRWRRFGPVATAPAP